VIPLLEPIHVAQGLSGVAFAGYGLHCLMGERMKQEFERYGLSRWRSLTGWLQIAGSCGLLLGFSYPVILLPSAAGLALLMLGGTVVRVVIGDPLRAAIPALLLLLLNLCVAIEAFRHRG
jgi:DoxX-like family